MTALPGDEIACIDHHPDNRRCAYSFVDIRQCGACASIITHYFKELGIGMDRHTATMLLYGLQMDTDNLQRGVAEIDIDAFRHLFPLADASMLRELAGRILREHDLRAFGKAFETILIRDRLAIVQIPFACEDYLVARVADFVLQLSEVDTSIVYCKRQDGLKFSARTILPNLHCGNLLREGLKQDGGCGGGHPHMAGGYIPKAMVPSLYNNTQSWEKRKSDASEFCNYLLERFHSCLHLAEH